MSTSWPRCTSSRAPAGVSATRYSSVLISLATPIRTARDNTAYAPSRRTLGGASGGRHTDREHSLLLRPCETGAPALRHQGGVVREARAGRLPGAQRPRLARLGGLRIA